MHESALTVCGIAGILDRSRRATDLSETAGRMADTLAHRGPDDRGVWADPGAGVAFGHRRLSIIDLSPAGHQPMTSTDGRCTIAYNGEIYNAPELRGELEGRGVAFRGHSDTEVLVECCAAWGVEKAVERLIGMFAFAAWEREQRRLTLVRDRLGIKPLYWASFGELFLFASELKALRAHAGWPVEIDRRSLVAYFRYGYVPAPHSIYRGVRKLEPGRILELDDNGAVRVRRYWDAHAVAVDGLGERDDISETDARLELETLLSDAVGRRMVADVPLGVFLSGGVDSSTVTALAQARSARPVRTFSIGFDEAGYNEARHAKAVAAHLGTDHTELYVRPDEARDVIPRLPELYDEPFADSSQIPTCVLSELTRRYVTVALSGDGGDELFAGYNRYFWSDRLWRWMRRIPRPARGGMARTIRAFSPASWDRAFRILPPRSRPPQPGDKLYKAADILPIEDPDAWYRLFVTHWDTLVPQSEDAERELRQGPDCPEMPGLIERMQFLDLVTYLPDDILTKVDRASMGASLEARVPILDHRIVAFAWRLPPRLKVNGGQGKWLLRQVLYRHVPRSLIDRPKMGFGVPIDRWLRGPLRDWAEDLLDERQLRAEGFVDADAVRRTWNEHLSGDHNWQYHLWDVLVFQAWKQRWLV